MERIHEGLGSCQGGRLGPSDDTPCGFLHRWLLVRLEAVHKVLWNLLLHSSSDSKKKKKERKLGISSGFRDEKVLKERWVFVGF